MIKNINDEYNKIKNEFLSAKFKGCKKFFEKNRYYLEQAYCELILDNITSAQKIFTELEYSDIRSHWGKVITEFIKGEVVTYPTYFEIRNFLEIDLNILINYCKGDYVEKIIRYADFMFTINPEVHKFIGRVLLNNGFKVQAMFFLKRAKDKFYQDPELHYILAELYYKEKDYDLAKKSLKTCLQILPNYAPAEMLLEKCCN